MADKAIWGVHMDWSLGLEPVEKGYIAIGWKDIGDLSKIPASREALKGAITNAYPDKKSGAIPVDAGVLFRFLHEMQIGDLVVYPSKPNRMVNLGIVDGPYSFDQSDTDYPNRRRVKWIRQIHRTDFSLDALHEIGAFITLFKITNNADEFIAAFEGQELPKVDSDLEAAESITSQAVESSADFVLKKLKTGLNPYQFEEFIAHLLECMGYHARVTQKSGDGGIDIIASKDELGFEPPIIKVQCKQTQNSIGQPEVAQLYGHVESKEFGLFVTLGNYTTQARAFERGKQNLRLVDGKTLVELIESHYSKFEPRYQVLLPLKKVYVPGVVSPDQSS